MKGASPPWPANQLSRNAGQCVARPRCPAVALPSQASAAPPHLQTGGGQSQGEPGQNILRAAESHRSPTARLGLGDRLALASVGRESHQSRGVLESVASLARCGTRAQFRELRRRRSPGTSGSAQVDGGSRKPPDLLRYAKTSDENGTGWAHCLGSGSKLFLGLVKGSLRSDDPLRGSSALDQPKKICLIEPAKGPPVAPFHLEGFYA